MDKDKPRHTNITGLVFICSYKGNNVLTNTKDIISMSSGAIFVLLIQPEGIANLYTDTAAMGLQHFNALLKFESVLPHIYRRIFSQNKMY